MNTEVNNSILLCLFFPWKDLKVTTIGEDLEQLLRKDVISEGNGITLGLSNTMTGFFTLKGPFIGEWEGAHFEHS